MKNHDSGTVGLTESGLPAVRSEAAWGSYALQAWTGSYCHFIDDRWTNYPHRHSDMQEICLVLRGSGEFVHQGRVWPLQPGSLFVNDLDVVHEIRSPGTRDLVLVFVCCRILVDGSGRAVADAVPARVLRAFLQGHHQHVGGQQELLRLVAALQAAGRGDVADWRQQACLQALVIEALAALSKGAITASGDRHEPQIDRALSYIRAHLSQSMGVDAIAAAAGCSARHLRRLFRQQDGRSVIQVVVDERLHKARRLLLMGFSVNASAVGVGIPSAARFCRLFKQRFDETPGHYQRRQALPVGSRPTEFGH